MCPGPTKLNYSCVNLTDTDVTDPNTPLCSFSRALSASELQEWHAEHSWRTACFMCVRACMSAAVIGGTG